jgi:hypothetical protein
VLVPTIPIPAPPELQRRFDRGKEFERDVLRTLLNLHPNAEVVRAKAPAEAEAATARAIAAGASLIIGGRLPTDTEGRRVGVPDLLIAAKPRTYRVVDIKHHLTTEPAIAERRGPVASVAGLEELRFEDAAPNELIWARKREEDLLQLAHYQRMLESADLHRQTDAGAASSASSASSSGTTSTHRCGRRRRRPGVRSCARRWRCMTSSSTSGST